MRRTTKASGLMMLLLLSSNGVFFSNAEKCPITKQLCDSSQTCHWSQDNSCISSLPCVLENTQAECEVNTFDCVWIAQKGCRLKSRQHRIALERRPTIILSLADDLGNFDVGFHNPRARTPNLDRLREQGVSLDRYYSSRFCAPTRAMILTGRQAWKIGLQTDANLNPVNAIRCAAARGATLLPGLLKDSAGYATHAFGKWHLGHFSDAVTPTRRGFDTFLGFYLGGLTSRMENVPRSSVFRDTRCACGTKKISIAQGMCNPHRRGAKLVCANAMNIVNETQGAGIRVVEGTSIVEDSIDVYLARRAEDVIFSTPAEIPLFLYMAWAAPHDPASAPQRFKDSLVRSRPEFGTDAPNLKSCPIQGRVTHLSMVMAMDEAHRILLNALDQTDRYDNSIVIFLSDNGGQSPFRTRQGSLACRYGSSFPLRGLKFSWWEGGVRTVGFVHAPMRIPMRRRGSSLKKLFSAVDWRKTILRASNAAIPEDDDGLDMWEDIVSETEGEGRSHLALQVWLETNRYVILFQHQGALWKIMQGYPSAGSGAGGQFTPLRMYSRSDISQPFELPRSEISNSTVLSSGLGQWFECAPYCLMNLTEDPNETVERSKRPEASGAFARGRELIAYYKTQGTFVGASGLCDKGYYALPTLDVTDRWSMDQARKCGGFVPWLDVNGKRKLGCA